MTRAFILHVALPDKPEKGQYAGKELAPYLLQEGIALVGGLGVEIISHKTVFLSKIRPSTLIGEGVLGEVRLQVQALDISLVVVNTQLSPVQQRNLEKAWDVKILDRTALILEIFGARARTREGALQVELAALNYQKSRLVRSWTHLERQRGGLGFIGGPGESQIELDRRMIQQRIKKIEKDLEKVVRTRMLHREARRAVPYPIVALVGYTNAGKSTLFNALTAATVYAQDQLFATLDPTMRAVKLSPARDMILSDTVGFISDLPHELVAAFRATLEEVCEAHIILHVHDAASPYESQQAEEVARVLESLDINPQDKLKIIHVYNKVDLLADEEKAALEQRCVQQGNAVMVSAVSAEGLVALKDKVLHHLTHNHAFLKLHIPFEEGKLLAWLYRNAEVHKRVDGEAAAELLLSLSPRKRDHLEKQWPHIVA